MAVGLAVAQINEGKVDAALSLLDEAINSSSSPNIGAYVARGTARALKRELEGSPRPVLAPCIMLCIPSTTKMRFTYHMFQRAGICCYLFAVCAVEPW